MGVGWHQIGWSAEVLPGDVRPVELGPAHLALYRGHSQLLMLVDAFCPHMGAHLAYGGCVVDDDIVCPFHGWRWAPSGSNVEIPYSEKANDRKFTRHWVVREEAGLIVTWYDADGGSSEPDTDVFHDVPDREPERRRDFATSADLRNVREIFLDGVHMARALGLEGVTTSVASTEKTLTFRHTFGSKGTKEEVTGELKSPGIATVRSSERPGVYIVSWSPRATSSVQVRVGSYGTAQPEAAWVEDYLVATLPLVEQMRYVDELAPLSSEEPLALARHWFKRHEV
jgi:phenylpropionate dioxygenase-like ring-hydroxylating dioxygenase large terminal subunit